jgi:hypothetical protein
MFYQTHGFETAIMFNSHTDRRLPVGDTSVSSQRTIHDGIVRFHIGQVQNRLRWRGANAKRARPFGCVTFMQETVVVQ